MSVQEITVSGGKCYIIAQNVYHKISEENGGRHFKCREVTCNGTAVVNQGRVTTTSEHNHAPPDLDVMKFKEKLYLELARPENRRVPAQKIYDNVRIDYLRKADSEIKRMQIAACLPEYGSVKTAMYRRKRHLPSVPEANSNSNTEGQSAASECDGSDISDDEPTAKGDEDEPTDKRVCVEDEEYFKSYGDISIHEEMIRDTVRTNTYRLAILRSVDRLAGKVVLDVGAGTGILSCFCVQAGAKKVYAIEASEMAEQAKKVVEANGMSDRIQVIRDKVEEVNLPEKVDVIVSEWMGHFLLYESMLNSVIFARNKWLKQGGLILPSRATLYLAPITNEDIYKERIDFWKDVKTKYGVDMTCLTDFARKCIFRQVQLEEIIGSDLIANGCQIAELNIHTATLQDLNKVMGNFRFRCFGSLPFCGFVSWFTVTFDIPRKEPLTISTAPNKHTTHWKQCVMYLDTPAPVEQDHEICGSISLTPGEKHKRCLDVSLTYQVENQNSVTKRYHIGPEEDG